MSKRILVVEDQPDNRQIIRDMLARTDYEITEAENGEEALAAIAKKRPDLILMDIQLPIMDGYTAVSRIKAVPAFRSIPIIAVTSYALNGEEKKARAAGCDDYVPKPFSPRQLLAKIAIPFVSLVSFAAEKAHETTAGHQASRRSRNRMAARYERAACDAGNRLYPRRVGPRRGTLGRRFPEGTQRNRVRRGQKRDGRVPL